MTDQVDTHDAEEDVRNQSILIWEGLRLHAGTWISLDEHLDRLFEAAKAIDLTMTLDRQGPALAPSRVACRCSTKST